METSAPQPAFNNSKQNLRNFIYGLVGLIIVALVIISGIGIFRVYRIAATDRFTLLIARIWHLPVAKVNSVSIPYTEYAADLAAINTKSNYDKAHNGPTANLTADEKSDQVIWRLVNNTLIKETAKKMNITATSQDTEDIKNRILEKFQTTAAADAQLSTEYGWNLATYQEKVVVPFVLGNKITGMLETDPTIRAESRALAQNLLDQIKKGADFNALAEKYGEDGTAQAGGDLGWFPKGEMVPQFEEAVFALKKGELSPELVETAFGYHVIKKEDERISKVQDEQTKKTINQPEIKARHILIRFASLTRFLNKATTAADLHLYVNIHNPFLDIKK